MPSPEIKPDDKLLINRDGVDYSAEVSQLDLGGGGIGDDEAPDDGLPYCRNGSTQSWVKGLPLDLSTLPQLP